MAWWAECVRRNWPCINAYYAIYEYKKYLYDEWWNSLTEEQKERIERKRQLEKEKKRRELEACFERLGMMTAICAGGPYSHVTSTYYNKSMKALAGLAKEVLHD